MYVCQGPCHDVIGPRVPQIGIVVKSRAKQYSYKDAEGNFGVSHGHETVAEIRACPSCASVDFRQPQKDMSKLQIDVAAAIQFQLHAQTCKKALADCGMCQRSVKFFAGLPKDTLSLVLSEVIKFPDPKKDQKKHPSTKTKLKSQVS